MIFRTNVRQEGISSPIQPDVADDNRATPAANPRPRGFSGRGGPPDGVAPPPQIAITHDSAIPGCATVRALACPLFGGHGQLDRTPAPRFPPASPLRPRARGHGKAPPPT